MKQNFNLCLKVFTFAGLQPKKFKKENKFGKNLSAAWFCFTSIVYVTMMLFITLTTTLDHTNQFVDFFFYPIALFFNFAAVAILLLAVKMAPIEKEFWKLTEMFEEMFQRPIAIKKINANALSRILFTLFGFIAFISIGAFLVEVESDKMNYYKIETMILIPVLILRLSTAKFSFFVEVLHCCLAAMEKNIIERIFTLEDLRKIKQAHESGIGLLLKKNLVYVNNCY
jgi:hypothetical protein